MHRLSVWPAPGGCIPSDPNSHRRAPCSADTRRTPDGPLGRRANCLGSIGRSSHSAGEATTERPTESVGHTNAGQSCRTNVGLSLTRRRPCHGARQSGDRCRPTHPRAHGRWLRSRWRPRGHRRTMFTALYELRHPWSLPPRPNMTEPSPPPIRRRSPLIARCTAESISQCTAAKAVLPPVIFAHHLVRYIYTGEIRPILWRTSLALIIHGTSALVGVDGWFGFMVKDHVGWLIGVCRGSGGDRGAEKRETRRRGLSARYPRPAVRDWSGGCQLSREGGSTKLGKYGEDVGGGGPSV